MASVVRHGGAVALAADGASVTCGSRVFAVQARNGVYVLQLLLGCASSARAAIAMPAVSDPVGNSFMPLPPAALPSPLTALPRSDHVPVTEQLRHTPAMSPPLAALPSPLAALPRADHLAVMQQLRREPGTGVTISSAPSSPSCDIYPLGKSLRLSFPIIIVIAIAVVIITAIGCGAAAGLPAVRNAPALASCHGTRTRAPTGAAPRSPAPIITADGGITCVQSSTNTLVGCASTANADGDQHRLAGGPFFMLSDSAVS